MVLRILSALLAFGATATAVAHAQARPVPQHPAAPVLDTILARDSVLADVETVDIVRQRGLGDRMGAGVRRAMLDTLAAQRRRWAARRPRTYRMRTVKSDHCMRIGVVPEVHRTPARERLVVRDTSIVGTELAPIAAADKQRCLLPWRVEDLFAEVARALADTTVKFYRLEYDAAYGLPRDYLIFGDPYAPSEAFPCPRGCGARVESFVPVP